MQERAWLQLISKYGPITAIAVALVWFLAMHVDTQLHSLSTVLSAHIAETNIERRELRWFLKALCYNTARTDSERNACTPPPNDQ